MNSSSNKDYTKYILITGGAGYIGSTVANQLIDKGYKVLIIDNLSTGFFRLVNKKAKFLKCDIKNYNTLYKKLTKYKYKIYAVMHFAGSLSVKESQIKPLKYYNNNVLGTENILNISGSFKIQKFLFSSTCAVYGNTNKLKISELDSTLPISNYGKSKLFAEKLVQEFSKRYNLKFAILRYFNVVGADKKNRSGQISGNTIFKTLCKNLTNKFFQIDIFGDNYPTKDGSCIRDYIDVNDLSELHILCLNKLNKSKSFLLNCGYGKGYSVKEIVYAFSSYIKKKIKINIKNRREGDAEAIYCDTRKLKKIFPKWKGSSNIQDSIKTAMNWEKNL